MRKNLSFWTFCLWGLSLATVLAAQPSNTCTGADLTGADTLPESGIVLDPSDDFSTTGAGCSSLGDDDWVACMVPENSCEVRLGCTSDASDQRPNVYAASCGSIGAGTPCLASASVAATVDVALTGGTEYCFVCDSNGIGSSQAGGLSLTAINGTDCGSLPVSLQSFSIDESR